MPTSSIESMGVVTMTSVAESVVPAKTVVTPVIPNNEPPPPPPPAEAESKSKENVEEKIPATGPEPLPTENGGKPPIMQQLNKLLTPPDDLLQWKDMPQHLQFNPYVLTGYRPLQGIKGCLSSLFYVHNETINILTHGK